MRTKIAIPHALRHEFTLLAALVVLSGCTTTDGGEPPGTTRPSGGEEEPAIVRHWNPEGAVPIAGDIYLDESQLVEVQYTSGMTMGTPEPKEVVRSPYSDGMTLFSYGVTELGGVVGKELIVVVMNARPGERYVIPTARAKNAFITNDPAQPHYSAESGYITIEEVNETHLAGRFEVRFDELASAIVRGAFQASGHGKE